MAHARTTEEKVLHRSSAAKRRLRESVRVRERGYAHRKNLRRFGLEPCMYDAMLQAQNGVCRICKRPERVKSRNGSIMRLAIDHCHVTGAVRGLLCNGCNTALGKANDDPHLLRAMADYLELRSGAGLGADRH